MVRGSNPANVSNSIVSKIKMIAKIFSPERVIPVELLLRINGNSAPHNFATTRRIPRNHDYQRGRIIVQVSSCEMQPNVEGISTSSLATFPTDTIHLRQRAFSRATRRGRCYRPSCMRLYLEIEASIPLFFW